jgi:glycosyltransferase involved in cell wall biosynthesis
MRVLVTGYSPRTHASYGTIIRELWTRLLKSGEFQMEQHAWLNVPSMDDVTWKLWPTQSGQRKDGKIGFLEEDKWGAETFEAVLTKFKPTIVWNLGDIYMSKYIDAYKRRFGFKLVRWTLSEGEPVDRENIPYIQGADKTVAITKYTADKWKEITGDDYTVIYHGVDLDVFHPVSRQERDALRKEVTNGTVSSDDYLISYIGRNQARKRPWIPFEIIHYLSTGAWGWTRENRPRRLEWDPVARRHKDDKSIEVYADRIPVKLWVHSGNDGTRWNFDLLEKQWNIAEHVLKTVGYSDQRGLPPDQMARIYQISDILSMLSGSEGFGVPIIEATACGIPTVYTDYAGCGEIGRICHGVAVGYTGWEPCPVNNIRWVYPDISEGLEAFYNSYRSRDYWAGKSAILRDIAKKNFDHNLIAEQWLNVMRLVDEIPLVETVGVRI